VSARGADAAAARQVNAAKGAVAEAERVARQLSEAAARARGEVDATRASLKETAPQLFEAQSLQSQARRVAVLVPPLQH